MLCLPKNACSYLPKNSSQSSLGVVGPKRKKRSIIISIWVANIIGRCRFVCWVMKTE